MHGTSIICSAPSPNCLCANKSSRMGDSLTKCSMLTWDAWDACITLFDLGPAHVVALAHAGATCTRAV